jgi:phosphoribosylglycinamide formyltransferase-1
VAYRSPKLHSSREAYDKAVITLLKQEGVDCVVLAGYMRILSPVFIRAFKDRILNIHPALLPAFKGGTAINDALGYGAKMTGVTVHIVDEEVDHGPIVAQAAVPIGPAETRSSLEAKIHKVEHRLYPQVIGLFAKGKLKVVGRAVKIG